MAHREIQEQDPHPFPHEGHRLLDVTAVGELPRTLLCLDCKTKFVEALPLRDRGWMERTL